MLRLVVVLGCLCIAGQHHAAASLFWTRLDPPGARPTPRTKACTAFDASNGLLYVFGGETGSGGLSQELWTYSLGLNQWTDLSNATQDSPPAGRTGHICGYSPTRLSFYVGMGLTADGAVNDVWRFGTINGVQRWQLVEPADPSRSKPGPRYDLGGGLFEATSELMVTHGRSAPNTLLSDTWVLDLDTLEWWRFGREASQYTPRLPHSRHSTGFAIHQNDSFGLLFGGCLSGDNSGGPCPVDDVWIFDLADKTWEDEDLPRCPTPRTNAALAQFDGQYLVLFGGTDDGNQVVASLSDGVNDVNLFHVAFREWSRVRVRRTDSQVPPIGQREGHSMSHYADGSEFGTFVFAGKTTGSGVLLNDLWTLTGDPSTLQGNETLSGCSAHGSTVIAHGFFMVIGWGLFLQAGPFFAHFMKARDPWWYTSHRDFNLAGLSFAWVGFGFALASPVSGHFNHAHGVIGLLVMILGSIQPFLGFFVLKKPTPDGTIRNPVLYRWTHRLVGQASLILALVNISLGVFLVVAPRQVVAVWFSILVPFVLLLAALLIQRWEYRPEPPVQPEGNRISAKEKSSASHTLEVSRDDRTYSVAI